MKPIHSHRPHCEPLLVEADSLRVETPNGRPLFMDLSLRMGREKAALVGRNGVGKSTLLAVLAGMDVPRAGRLRVCPNTILVPQEIPTTMAVDPLAFASVREIDPEALHDEARKAGFDDMDILCRGESLSRGEGRKRALLFAKLRRPDLLLLDEPTFGLDFVGLSAMTSALCLWPGGLLVISHDRELLRDIGIEQEIRMGGLRLMT